MTGPVKHQFSIQDSVVVTNIGDAPNPSTDSTIDFDRDASDSGKTSSHSKPNQLKELDDLFGPLQFGASTITRRSLDALGATVNG